MGATASKMVQLNVRVDAEVKKQAEEVMRLMGTTSSQLVRALYEKVASGARDYDEAAAVLTGEAREEQCDANPPLATGWAAADDFYRSLGYARAGDVPADNRTWQQVYDEAMLSHYQEKGLIG